MNRIAIESIAGGRRASVGSHLHQFRTSGGGGDEDGLDLFARTRRSDGGAPISNRSDGESIRLERISLGTTRTGRGMEDLFDAEIGKHDYDWLLTPPETPLYPSAVARESSLSATARESPLSSTTRETPVSSLAPRGRNTARSVSNQRPSRLSASQTENGHSTRPVRSNSVTRSSISSSYSSTSFSNNNNRTSVLNTSSASVTSSRPSTPGTRSPASRPSSTSRPSSISTNTRPSSSSTTVTRPSSSTSRPSSTARPSSIARPSISRSVPSSRMPTPTRTRPNSIPSSDRTTRPSNNSRPSTPTSSRPQTPSNPSLNPRANSRPSTPTRRPTSSAGSSTSSVIGRLPSVGRISSANTRNPTAPTSRASSPGPRPRAPVRPIDLPDFPSDAPPNLRTKLPERPVSAGRSRPGMAALSVRANSNTDAAVPAVAAPTASSNRRNYMPVVSTRSKFPENPPKASAKSHGGYNGHDAGGVPEIHKLASLDGGLRRPVKMSSALESTGFGRNISKKSLDMALRHMDIRQGMGGIRASSLFPQSIRSSTTGTKGRPIRKSDPVVPLASDELMAEIGSYNGTISPDCRSRSSMVPSESGGDFTAASKSPDRDSLATRESELDLHGSSQYDSFMLKEEDSENMNWLHSAEDKSDQSPVFDHRFEPLPEPFGLL